MSAVPPTASSDVALSVEVEALEQLAPGTSYADAVHRMLTVIRTQLGMKVAWLSDFVGEEQVLRFVDAEPGARAPAEGTRLPVGGSFCARVLDGRFPALIPDARAVPEAALLDVTSQLSISAYVGVPMIGPQGVVVGMLCVHNDSATPTLTDRDLSAVRLLADLLRDLQHRALSAAQAAAERDDVVRALTAVVDGRGRHAVLQPVVDLSTGRAVAAEGLTRFTASNPASTDGVARSSAQWFDDAGRLGLREDLELATAASVLDLLDGSVPADVALTVNLGPDALLGARLAALLEGRPLDRIVVELTENAAVADYDRLADVLRPYREAGMRLAVDDAGAGYSSLRHVLAVRPDLIKVDMALTRGADGDLARRTLLTALAGFARQTDCRIVAEGVETAGELDAMRSCGIDLVQGYYLARPSENPSWGAYPML